jgi:2-keto-4-pentenoate hydratase/2-oxohepta-3-ene-1,7-dioic acid hydratase in catechol pathway
LAPRPPETNRKETPTREPPFFFQKPTDAIENVGPVVRGDGVECHIDHLPRLSVKMV